MKLRWTLLVIAVWLVTPALVEAQNEGGTRRQAKMQRRPGDDRGPGVEQARIERIREELDLDEEQLVEFDRIATEFKKKRGDKVSLERHQSLIDELRRAREAGDEGRAAQLRDQLREARSGSEIEQFFDAIEDILRDDQRAKLGEIRERFEEHRRGGGRGPLAQLRHLRGELNLNERQGRRYDQLYDELEATLQQGQAGDADTDEIVQKIREAAAAGDDASVKELAKQLPDARGRTSQAIADFFDQVASFLEPEQVSALERFRRRMNRESGEVDLRTCFRFVSRLDLDEEQRAALRVLQREVREREREARRDPDARAQITQDAQQQLRDLLTPEQAAEYDEWLARQDSERRSGDRSRRNRERESRSRRAGEQQP